MTLPAELSKAERMLADAKSIADLRTLRDFASSLRTYAQSRHLGVEAENQAAVFILRAERAAGQELIRMAAEGERSGRGWPKGVPHDKAGRIPEGPKTWDQGVTLKDLGISRSEASDWQRLAMVSDEHFERRIAEALAPGTDGRVRRISKQRFYPWPEKRGRYIKRGNNRGISYRDDDPLTPFFFLRTTVDQVLGASLASLPSSDLVELGRIGVRLVKAARAELDRRGGQS